MQQRDWVEIVGGLVSLALVSATVGTLGHAYAWPRSVYVLTCGSLGGFTMGEIGRRVKRRRTEKR